MESMFKLTDDIKEKLMDNYNDALKDAYFKKLVNSIKVSEEEKIINTSKFQDSISELNNCQKCKGLFECKNKTNGYVYYPETYDNHLNFVYRPCKYKKEAIEKEENKITRDKELENASMKDIDTNDKARLELLKWITRFINEYDSNKKMKGLYLHGNFGSGKTYIISAAFNELRKKGYKTDIIYFPTLLRDLKSNFDELESTILYLENIDLLLIDDIGAEKVSEWSRDEILGTILQTRMNNFKTTFFTSNYNIDELEKHLANKTDEVASARIIERIKVLTDDIELQGENKRK